MEIAASTLGADATAYDVAQRFTWEQVWVNLARARERYVEQVRKKHGLDHGVSVMELAKGLKGVKK